MRRHRKSPLLMRLRIALGLILTVMAAIGARAQRVERPVTSAWTIGIGQARIADTYLTPLRYVGTTYSIDYERFQAMRFNPRRWIMRLDINAAYNEARNPARNAVIRNPALRASWAMMWRTDIPAVSGLRIAAGGETGIDLGISYLARNGNNPVSARAAWTAGVTGMALYNLRIGRLPMTLRYQISLPLAGMFFSPAYGELYYEIALGNRSGLIHAAWPGNRFAMDNTVTADLRFGATALRIGYAGHILSGKVSNIVTRTLLHAVTIGVAGEWMSLSPSRRPSPEVTTIQAYY